MRLLLDTHVLLWARSQPERLSPAQLSAVRDPSNTVFVSAITVAEIGIKSGLGKLAVPDGFIEGLGDFGLDHLPFTSDHATRLQMLPLHHRDPFDRMLICQAAAEDLVFVTGDARCAEYDIRVLM